MLYGLEPGEFKNILKDTKVKTREDRLSKDRLMKDHKVDKGEK